jgi:hypothetical protein
MVVKRWALGAGGDHVVQHRDSPRTLAPSQKNVDAGCGLRERSRGAEVVTLADVRSDSDDVWGCRECACRGFGPGVLGRDPVEVALEPARRDHEHVAPRAVAEVGEGVVDAAACEGELAPRRGPELLAELKRELAVEDVERLVEFVSMQRRPLPMRRDAVLHHADLAPRFLASQQNSRFERHHSPLFPSRRHASLLIFRHRA